jgi:hypothetical protein
MESGHEKGRLVQQLDRPGRGLALLLALFASGGLFSHNQIPVAVKTQARLESCVMHVLARTSYWSAPVMRVIAWFGWLLRVRLLGLAGGG